MRNKKILLILSFCIIFSLFLSSCGIFSNSSETKQKLSSSETVFEVNLPEPLKENEKILFEVLDEVTGIALNPTRYTMEKKDDLTFFIRLPLINGSILKYRYIHRSDVDTIEQSSFGENIQYRSYLVSRPSIVKDSIFSWEENTSPNELGEISGFVYDEKTNLPIPDILISVNGNTTFSQINGFYELKNLPIGDSLITAIHPDGIYEPFQQGAVIAQNALTPASFGMDKAKIVDVTFEVSVPVNTIEGAPLRLIGNTYSTGNLFEEIAGGTTILSSRAPQMIYDGNGKYHITIELPSGSDFRYKYTLGDGFINAEHSSEGDFVTRQFIIPKKDATVNNTVATWSPDDEYSPVTIYINAPENTPPNDFISIQFNPFTWLQPLPAWKIDENKWMFTLYGPFDYMENSQFRFCRNNMCGYADDEKTSGKIASGFLLNYDELPPSKSITYSVENWVNIENQNYLIEPSEGVKTDLIYLKSITFSEDYDPQWLLSYEWGIIDIALSGSNSFFISPSWKLSKNYELFFDYRYSDTFQTAEIDELLAYAKDADLLLNFYPQPEFSGIDFSSYWENAPLTYNWWINWFESYSRFINNYAHLASQKGAKYFIIGGPSISPALPGGRLPNGSPSNTPYDIADQWSNLIQDIRDLYNGTIIFSLDESMISNIDNYSFLNDVDAVMVVMDGALSENESPNYVNIKNRVSQYLDSEIIEIPKQYGRPVILGLNYSSVDGTASNCINFQSTCIDLLKKGQIEDIEIDLNEQADVYSAILSEALKRDWIVGFNSFGFYPSVIVQDHGISVRGKPAYDVLSYYYNQVLD